MGDLTLDPRKYAELIGQPLVGPIWSGGLRQQIYLGGEGFVQRMQGQAEKRQLQAPAVPRAQRASANDMCGLAALNAYIGNSDEALRWCKQLDDQMLAANRQLEEWEAAYLRYTKDLAAAIHAGGVDAYLQRQMTTGVGADPILE